MLLLTIAAVVIILVSPTSLPALYSTNGVALPISGLAGTLSVAIPGLIFSLVLFVTANQLDLMLALEENTRATAIILRKMLANSPNSQGPDDRPPF